MGDKKMGNSTEHLFLGAAVGLGLYWGFCKATEQHFEWSKALACTGIGSLCGLLPDIIEPAMSPAHRQTAHSMLLLFGLALGQKSIIENRDITQEKKLLLSTAILSYGSHLLLDATTPAGLPAA